MQSLLTSLKQQFYIAAQQAFPNSDIDFNTVEITISTQAQFGHYQCNSAMKLTKILGQNPRTIAAQWLTALQQNELFLAAGISHCEIAGPGFINIHLDKHFLASYLQAMLNDTRLGIPTQNSSSRIIVDFSSPNTAKEMHVGHLRSTIIGDCLARTFEFLGYEVLRLNHIGNWGTSFGMLIAYLKQHQPNVLTQAKLPDLSQLVNWYRAAKKQFDDDAKFKQLAQAEVVALQKGEASARIAWQIICDISRLGFQSIYDALDIQITERGESFYNPYLDELVADLEAKQLITLSDGAKCIFLEGFVSRDGTALPLIIQKSDGGYNYAATDLAALRYRINTDQAQRIIYVVDAGQSMHFQMIFKAAEKANYLNPKQVRAEHVPFGLVLGQDGKKFRTRSGETERLMDLIEHAITCAQEKLVERGVSDFNAQTAHILGINAIKYADLSCQRISDYEFSYDRMLRFEGNTAAFLMYAYVRIASIKRKIGIRNVDALIKTTTLQLTEPAEIELALQVARFADALLQLSEDLFPHRLCDYLFVLAEKFNAFFRDCRVEGTTQQDSRLLLCEATARVLKLGLNLLGLKTLEHM